MVYILSLKFEVILEEIDEIKFYEYNVKHLLFKVKTTSRSIYFSIKGFFLQNKCYLDNKT